MSLTQLQYGMRLDTRSHIFQNLNGAEDEVELEYSDNETQAHNSMYNTRPAILHGNGPSKVRIEQHLHILYGTCTICM